MRRLLLDTHAALFWWGDSPKFGKRAAEAMAEPETLVFVSAASAWEIGAKFRTGKLDVIGDPSVHYPRLMIRHDFRELPITAAHGLHAGMLPGPHRDPFDRLIAAQALAEDLIVVTRDAEIRGFGCEVLW